MICAEWHPDDERLLGHYVEPTTDPTLDQHVRWCRACAHRLATLAGELDAWHLAASGEADEAFDDQRLAAQRRSIQQRLGAAVPARVLPFPVVDTTQRHAPLARVAAAVLLVALTGAGLVRVLYMPQPAPSAVMSRSVAHRTGAQARPVREVSAELAVLEDIDTALLRPRTAVAELRALDEFTPHVRDLVAPRR